MDVAVAAAVVVEAAVVVTAVAADVQPSANCTRRSAPSAASRRKFRSNRPKVAPFIVATASRDIDASKLVSRTS